MIFQYLAFEVAYVANNLRYADFTRKKKKKSTKKVTGRKRRAENETFDMKKTESRTLSCSQEMVRENEARKVTSEMSLTTGSRHKS